MAPPVAVGVMEEVLRGALVALPGSLVEVSTGHHTGGPARVPTVDDRPDDEAADWHRPFFVGASLGAADDDVVALRAAVEQALAVDPSCLPEEAALARAAELLALSERLQAAVLTAVGDVDARDAFTAGAAGSTRSWLRRSVTGDSGQLVLARRLRRYRHVHQALAAGTVGEPAADHVTSQLSRLPETLPADQLAGVLEHGLPDLLEVAFGGSLTADRRTPAQQALAAELAQVVVSAQREVTAPPDLLLEPAFTLLARALPLRHLQSATAMLLDALAPERVLEREDAAHDARSWRLVKKRLTPGYRLEADLTVEDGLALQAEIDARTTAAEAAAPDRDASPPAGGDDSAASGHADDDHVGGCELRPGAGADDASSAIGTTDGSGTSSERDRDQDGPLLTQPHPPAGAARPGPPEPTAEQRRCAAFVDLVRDAAAARGGSATAHPFTYVITASLADLGAAAGVLPGTLTGPDGRVSLSAAALRRLGCGSPLSLVLLDAARNPVGASSTRRHATERERRALRARQGDLCGISACPNPWTVPHHVEPWWKTARTALKDLLGVCRHCHHDVHDGRRTLLLRDGRYLDENGWVDVVEQ